MIFIDLTVPFIGSMLVLDQPRPKPRPFWEFNRAGSDLEVWIARWYVIFAPPEKPRTPQEDQEAELRGAEARAKARAEDEAYERGRDKPLKERSQP